MFGSDWTAYHESTNKFQLDSNDLIIKDFVINPFSKDNGIVPRTISNIFSEISKNEDIQAENYTVYCSYMQIYNEKIYDLLCDEKVNDLN